MAISSDDLRSYVGASTTDAVYVDGCLATAKSLIEALVGAAVVPEGIVDRATLEAGSELFHRRQAPNGIAQFATADGGSPVRVARDPLVSARPILAPYLPLGFS